jgi:hypothetical protein
VNDTIAVFDGVRASSRRETDAKVSRAFDRSFPTRGGVERGRRRRMALSGGGWRRVTPSTRTSDVDRREVSAWRNRRREREANATRC